MKQHSSFLNRSHYIVFVAEQSETEPLPPAAVESGTLSPAGEDFGPDFPVCTDGTSLGTFGTYTFGYRTSHPEEIEVTLQTPDDFVARPGTLKVLQGEGHNWDDGHAEVSGPKSALSALPSKARQFQKYEIAEFYWQGTSSLMFLGSFDDMSPNGGATSADKDNITTEYSFPITRIQPGINTLTIRMPTPADGQVQSVFVRGTVCAGEASITPPVTPTPSDTPTPTPSDTPTPTPTVRLTPAPLQNAWASTVLASFQGPQKNLQPVRPERSNPDYSLGETDGNFFSLGLGGELVVGFECRIQNIDGPDLAVYESTIAREIYAEERALVEVSANGSDWYALLPIASNQSPIAPFGRTVLSLDATPLEFFQYVRFKDATIFHIAPFDDLDAFDVNTVEGFSEVCD